MGLDMPGVRYHRHHWQRGQHAAEGERMSDTLDSATAEQLWKDPDWTCPMCRFRNFAIRERCRNCGFDSALVSGDSYFPVRHEAAQPSGRGCAEGAGMKLIITLCVIWNAAELIYAYRHLGLDTVIACCICICATSMGWAFAMGQREARKSEREGKKNG
jgi:hypothetical protein